MRKFYPLCIENSGIYAKFSALARRTRLLTSFITLVLFFLAAAFPYSFAQTEYQFLKQINPSLSIYSGNDPDYCGQGQLLRTSDWFSGSGPYYLPVGSTGADYLVKIYNVTESSFSWESKLPISTLVVKAGDFARMYSYTQPTFGATGVITVQKSDPPAQLVSGPKTGYFRISHVEFCYNSCGLSPNVSVTDSSCDAPGSITVSPSGKQYSLDGLNWQSQNIFDNMMPGVYRVFVSNEVVNNKPVCAEPLKVTVGGIPPGPAKPTASIVEPTCESNTSSITVSNAQAGLLYSIDGVNYQSEPVFSNLSPNTSYQLTAKNANGCISPALEIVIGPIIKIELTLSSTNVTCNGVADGTITASATQNALITINGLPYVEGQLFAPGTYSVVATTGLEEAGCTITKEIIITEPAALVTSAIAQDAVCFGTGTGTVDLSVEGGTAPYRFSWSNGATSEDLNGVPAGSYAVTVTDANGCQTTTSITITEPVALVASSSATAIACNRKCYGYS